jgi:hypothetical protein
MRKQGVFGIEDEAGEYSPGLLGSTVQLNVGSATIPRMKISVSRSSGGKVKLTVGSLKKALAASRRNKKKRVKILRYQSTMPASLCLQDAWRCAISDAK